MDLRIVDGVVTEAAPHLERAPGEDVIEAAGRWVVPGLWDQHVHLTQWSQTFGRLDVSAAGSAAETLTLVRDLLATTPSRRDLPAVGYGFRHALWPDNASLAALDAVAGDVPVILMSGDVHCGWLSSRARQLLDVPPTSDDDGLVRENDWFAALTRLAQLPGPDPTAGYRRAMDEAAARGIVGITDMEWAANAQDWPGRVAAGLDLLRLRTATYADRLDDILAAGLRTGDRLHGGRGLLTMGPLKVISDGSLNTATAHTVAPYSHPLDPAHPHGVQNVAPDELVDLVRRATAGGLAVAIHAIGDAAVGIALDAIEEAGASGSVEHAQLLSPGQASRFAALDVVASIQPAHLLDDRDITEDRWPGRGGRVFVLRELLDAGARVAFGSDAPVAPLDPWLAMAAAVHRSGDERPAWHPEQHITAVEALAASTDGQGTVEAGSRGDIVLLDADPLAGPGLVPVAPVAPDASDSAVTSRGVRARVDATLDTAAMAAHLRAMPVAATLVAGRTTYRNL
ncbi:amidohydrolase family protein [Georgenia subflava]|uniref:Amidohydrolase family protein n=1 Tax=Georgenia subflava TaxID=1622177 RepID=A0A6N7EMW7_9MICO|nr:amidohydrolase family protein [Georgenia subflava]